MAELSAYVEVSSQKAQQDVADSHAGLQVGGIECDIHSQNGVYINAE